MPEGPVLKAWVHRFHRHLAGTKDKLQARFVFYPRCFAMGTAVKDYVTCSTQQVEGYNPAMDRVEEDRPEHMQPSKMDRERSKKKPWEYLLENRLSGEFLVGVRGKVLAVAAGHHLVFVNFGLEANVLPVSSDDYAAFAAQSQDVPGPNKSKQKAKKMRSFAVPDQYKEDKSTKPAALRRLNIFLAIACSDGTAWLFVDHVRLIRFHVVSRAQPWTAKDLELESPVWQYAWDGKYGHDWFARSMSPAYRLIVSQQLYNWRAKLLSDIAEGKTLSAPAADVISEDMETFNGFGKHTAMDLLHAAGILPHIPIAELVQSDEYFNSLHDCIFDYLAKFDQPAFFQKCASRQNSKNPLSFHTGADAHYISTYVSVYRRARVRIPAALYNRLAKAGLLDPSHTIGDDYSKPVTLAKNKYKYCLVYKYTAGEGSSAITTYSIIQARPPSSWGIDHWVKGEVTDDIRTVGLMTTLGLAQFYQFNTNTIRYDENTKSKGGRPSIEHTGKRGRPRKAQTASQLKQLAKRGQKSYYPKPLSTIDSNADQQAHVTSSNERAVRMTRSQTKRKRKQGSDVENTAPLDSGCSKRARTS